uniref:Molybdopterin synthase catalytic subunit n=1 Tax=Rhizochromulina marina TaxID=1034831 RepID=A0A7S2SVJ8_9STRA
MYCRMEGRMAALALGVGVGVGLALVPLWVNARKRVRRFSGEPDHVYVWDGPLCVEELVAHVNVPTAGAIATFSGVTRNSFGGRTVTHLEYEAYTAMAEKKMREICADIREQWQVERIAIEHKLGGCPVGETSIIIAVSSAHRKEALAAVEYAINTLKATVPIWKKEFFEGDDPAIWKANSEFKGGGTEVDAGGRAVAAEEGR